MAANTFDESPTRAPIVAHHFNNILQQQATIRFGMWLFLVTEVLFFGGVFCAYAVYRMWYPLDFIAGSTALNPLIAGINSFLLLTSSFTATLAIRAAWRANRSMLKLWLGLTILLGTAFLGFKAYEYYTDYKEGLIPSSQKVEVRSHQGQPHHGAGRTSQFAHNIEHVLLHKQYFAHMEPDPITGQMTHVRLNQVNLDRTRLFFMFYYGMTGLHVIHMIIGIGLFVMQFILASRGYFDFAERYVYVEVLALYWHFVELVWIFLLPLLYMAGNHSFADLSL